MWEASWGEDAVLNQVVSQALPEEQGMEKGREGGRWILGRRAHEREMSGQCSDLGASR